jgi:hypothetical protein
VYKLAFSREFATYSLLFTISKHLTFIAIFLPPRVLLYFFTFFTPSPVSLKDRQTPSILNKTEIMEEKGFYLKQIMI